MLYRRLAEVYEQVSGTTRRSEMIGVLVDLLEDTPAGLIHQMVYLTQGKLYPDYEGVEIGMAERLALRTVAEAAEVGEEEVRRGVASTGDLGLAAQGLLESRNGSIRPSLLVEEVYRGLDEIARTGGKGSVAGKVGLLADLLRRATPLEAKYILRTATGKLRLGLADMTILDALAQAYGGGRGARREIERAYNLCSDLGAVAAAVATGGVEAAREFHLQPGKPLRPMLAQRLPSPDQILSTLGGSCQAEYKYDGERLQIHKIGARVRLFSRRLEEATHQYPDVARAILAGMKARDAILEGEAVAMNPDSGELLPFQELMHRRRKHGIKEMMASYPVALFAFDLLYRDGEDLTLLPFPDRRRALEEVIAPSELLSPMPGRVVHRVEDLERFFQEALEVGCEGLVCKSLGPDSIYEAGGRGWNWIKYKREYVSAMTDTVDLVVVGAFHGRGRRGGGYGALLLSSYDPEADSFPTLTKCGTGFSHQELMEEMPRRLEPSRLDHPHPLVNSRMKADVWFAPSMVVEVLGAELTLSPVHTTDWGVVRPGAGLALRFPRFTGRYRTDKAPTDATTSTELLEMYRARIRKVA